MLGTGMGAFDLTSSLHPPWVLPGAGQRWRTNSRAATSPPSSQAGAAFPTQIFPAIRMKTRSLLPVTQAKMWAAPRRGGGGPHRPQQSHGRSCAATGRPQHPHVCQGVSDGCWGRRPDPMVMGSAGNLRQRLRAARGSAPIRVGGTRAQSTGTETVSENLSCLALPFLPFFFFLVQGKTFITTFHS